MPSQKNMRKIERRLSTPNRSNGTRKSAGKLTISRGADGAKADIGKMTGRICRVELAVCNLNRSPVNIPIIELIIFTLFVFPLTIILFRALSHGNSIVFINF